MTDQFQGEGFSLFGRLQDWITTIFPERQIHLRTDGRVNYFRITTTAQLAALILVSLSGWWIGYSSYSYVKHGRKIVAKNSQIASARLAYHSLLGEVGEYQNKFNKITNDLERNHSTMLALVDRNAKLRNSLHETSDKLRNTENDRARVANARETLINKLAKLKDDKHSLVDRNAKLRNSLHETSIKLRSTKNDRARIVNAREALFNRLGDLKDEMNGVTSHNFVLKDNLEAIENDLKIALSERNHARFERTRIENYVQQLETRLADLQQSQGMSVQRLSNHTARQIDDLERVISLAGIDPRKLAGRDGLVDGQGGPFIPIESIKNAPTDDLKKSLDKLDLRLARLNSLQSTMRFLPLSAPLRSYYVTSGFGKRRDPLNKRWAAHYGVDFGSHVKAKVYSTAPGIVKVSGWKGRYGRYVEIDHGNGILTRYGHLGKSYVKRGEKVKFQQKIGLLGNSGRTTGPHLHYETVFKGRAINPKKFIKAGHYVFQRQ